MTSIRTGHGTRPRLADVASAAGVTVSIASRVLNGDPTLSARAETRERVVTAAAKLGYTPNAFARGLRKARTMTIGIVLPNLAYPVNAEIIRGAERRALAEGYVLLIADATEFGPASTAYERLVLDGRVDGLLVASTLVGESRARSRFPLPVVYVNRRGHPPGVSVSVDDSAGIGLAVDHLVELGHTQIGYIGGSQNVDTTRRRSVGFVDRVLEHGLGAPRSRMIKTGITEAAGFEGMTQLLASRKVPTGVVASTFAVAVGAMSAIGRSGLAVPRDISVVGFHDAVIADYLLPPLTTVRMPLAEMAETAVQTLTRLIDGTDAQSVVVETPEPVVIQRESTSAPSRIS